MFINKKIKLILKSLLVTITISALGILSASAKFHNFESATVITQNLTTHANNITLPNITNNASIAVVADGNSPDPDDIGATAVSLALLKSFGVENDLVYYSHSCDLDPFSGSRQTITPQQELNRQQLMQTSCDGTASRWTGFDHIAFYNCRTQRTLATDKLTEVINAATSIKPLAIILAGEPDIIYDAVQSAQPEKRQFVTIVSHHIANEESADEAGKNISDLERNFTAVTVDRIPDQNTGLKTDLSTWHWARDHSDSRIQWLWEQGKIAEQDGVVRFQTGFFDCSDAGMVYYQITGNSTPGVTEMREALTCYIDANPTQPTNNPPFVEITSPANGAVFAVGQQINLAANATDPDGNLDRVNFKLNDGFYASDNTQPFENTFTPDTEGTFKIAARAFDKDGLSTEVFVNINVSSTLSNNDFFENEKTKKLKIYPNPTTNELSLFGIRNKNATISIVDLNGRTILKTIINSSSNRLNVSNLSSGLYLIKLNGNYNNQTLSFIKK